mmetsp:Transcript_19494/g.48865  ORF Transcript_19494/g.48865 Transcript_19494/m.48865 type:complete len:205 (+) Transcript_19494:1039-1653(+)
MSSDCRQSYCKISSTGSIVRLTQPLTSISLMPASLRPVRSGMTAISVPLRFSFFCRRNIMTAAPPWAATAWGGHPRRGQWSHSRDSTDLRAQSSSMGRVWRCLLSLTSMRSTCDFVMSRKLSGSSSRSHPRRSSVRCLSSLITASPPRSVTKAGGYLRLSHPRRSSDVSPLSESTSSSSGSSRIRWQSDRSMVQTPPKAMLSIG